MLQRLGPKRSPKGEEIMRFYETLYLLRPDLSEDQYQELLKKYNDRITSLDGIVIHVDEWGKKNLAYPIRKFEEGYYIIVKYCGRPGIVQDLEKEFKLDENILRYLTVKLSDKADPEELKKRFSEDSSA